MKYDAHELRELGHDLSEVGPKMVKPMRAVFQESGDLLASEWAKNATETSGVHGKHYPKSIDAELRASFGIVVDVGPNTSKKQGSMGPGFEYGSVNQPPHLDGQRAADKVGPLIERAISLAVTELLP